MSTKKKPSPDSIVRQIYRVLLLGFSRFLKSRTNRSLDDGKHLTI